MPPAVPLGLSQNDVTSRRVTFLHLAVTLGDVTFPHVMWLKPGACMLIVSNYDRRTDQVIAVAVLFLLMRENWCRCDREIVMAAVAQVQLLCHGSHVVKRKCQSKCCVSSFAFLDYRYLFNSILFYIDSNYQIILLSVISISGHYWWLFVCVSISYHGYFCLVSWMFLSQDCMALQFASDDLRADREVILRATYFKDHFLPPACFQTYSWVWTSVFFQKTTLQIEAVHQSGSALEFVNEDLREEVLSCAIGRESQIGFYTSQEALYEIHHRIFMVGPSPTGEFFVYIRLIRDLVIFHDRILKMFCFRDAMRCNE